MDISSLTVSTVAQWRRTYFDKFASQHVSGAVRVPLVPSVGMRRFRRSVAETETEFLYDSIRQCNSFGSHN